LRMMGWGGDSGRGTWRLGIGSTHRAIWKVIGTEGPRLSAYL